MLFEIFVSVFTSVYFIAFLSCLLVLTGIIYHYLTRNFGKWEKKYGIKGLKPVPFFGTEKDFLLATVGLNDLVLNRYKEFEGHK